ncbi:DinB family protein [Alkalicoccobacillus plakortidis]|uniref:DinB family protein n=1 Tax=Alkalicoccobacillus plakortidis TaxID=444060 RepID=A0ABT0XLS5_9BACI|nr:DinB family protein [Alkalicoccobacillus plakortidis]MCM2676856.1 DinB family protein [Alkalicoccobacillus plakortidis]
MKKYFHQLAAQRTDFFTEYQDTDVWSRAQPNKWSIAETLYHLLLLLKRFRQLNVIYLPMARPLSTLRRNRPYKTASVNIYEQYNQKHLKAMKAPSIIMPPKNIQQQVSYNEMIQMLEQETAYLSMLVAEIDEDVAGHIRYPDPPAHYPNLIQAIHLLVIHEQHHFTICRKIDFK